MSSYSARRHSRHSTARRSAGSLCRQSLLFGLMAALLAIPVLAGAAGEDVWVDPRTMEFPPLGRIQVPEPERIIMDNGMIVYFLEDHDFPLVDARALMRIGSMYDPPDKVGLAAITAEVLRTGGSETLPGDELDHRLEGMGASIEISVSDTEGSVSVSTLSEDIEEGLRIMADLLRNPGFPEDKIDLAKRKEYTYISSRNDELFSIMGRELPKLIFGPGHPYARHTEYATIEAITRDDLGSFHSQFFHPDRIILTVYGDFRTRAVRELLADIFGDWPRSTAPLPPDPPVSSSPARGVHFAHKGDATNSILIMGHLGLLRSDPDFPAMAMAHEIMGGGFSSRLLNEIRTRRGLAYAAGSSSGAGFHHPGPTLFYVITQSDSVGVAAGYVHDEIDRMLTEPFTDEEVERARESILNSLVFTLSSRWAVLNRLAQYEFYGYPRNFLDRYQESITTLTADDLLQASRRMVRPEEFATLVVGNRDRVLPAISGMNPVLEMDISIPPPPGGELPEPTEADFARGSELLVLAAQAMGGETLAGLRDITYEEEGRFEVQDMVLEMTTKAQRLLPHCARFDQVLPMGTMVQCFCEESGWVSQPPQGMIREMTPDMLESSRQNIRRSLLTVLWEHPMLKAQALPDPAEVNGRDAFVLAIHDEQVAGWRLYIDAGTHLILRMDHRGVVPGGSGYEGVVSELYGDFREVGGLSWPHTRKIVAEDRTFATVNITSMEINTGLTPGDFAKPSD